MATPIRTKRLALRPVTQDDVAAVFGILGDQATTANVSFGLSDLESAERWVRRRMEQQGEYGLSMWAVELRADGPVGLVGFFPHDGRSVELGYVVHARHWGQGIASEAVEAMLQANLGAVDRVFATVRTTNAASLAVARRVGLVEYDRKHDDRGTLIVMRVESGEKRNPVGDHDAEGDEGRDRPFR